MNDLTKNILVFIVIIVVLLSVVQGLNGVSGPPAEKQDYSDFLAQVKAGQVRRAEFQGDRISYGDRAESLRGPRRRPGLFRLGAP